MLDGCAVMSLLDENTPASLSVLTAYRHQQVNEFTVSMIISIGLRADPGFLAVSLQMTLVISSVVGCHFFPPGPRLLSQPKISPPLGWYQIILLGDRGTQV